METPKKKMPHTKKKLESHVEEQKKEDVIYQG